ncbi:cation:proton antiporter regulatory subunit [Halarchaeum sp. P4]|uniref:cation:proton antiporter regulatory subunit n=1 Tax=Halarchaeum sp. P4 TaxID=3421639 RepID=UPI003EBF6482
MTIYETDIPGVGRKYEVETRAGERAVVVVHHDGRREVFHKPHADADAEKVFDLDSEDARDVVTALQGAGFQPVNPDTVEVPLGDAIIEWVDVPQESPVAGQTLGETQIREETGATVIALQRGETTIPSPNTDTTIEPGDIIVSVGSRAEQRALEALVHPEH